MHSIDGPPGSLVCIGFDAACITQRPGGTGKPVPYKLSGLSQGTGLPVPQTAAAEHEVPPTSCGQEAQPQTQNVASDRVKLGQSGVQGHCPCPPEASVISHNNA